MDPSARLRAFDDALQAQDRPAIAEHAEALVEWLEKRHGFMPVGPYSADWRGKLSTYQLASMLRMAAAIARMP